MAGLRISDVAARAGLSAPTIRYYEGVGLLARAPRSATGYRHYDDSTVDELRFIKKAQGTPPEWPRRPLPLMAGLPLASNT